MREEFISVVIPAYNEELRITPTIKTIAEYLKGNFRDFEIIVVDDGSRDKTVSVVESLCHDERCLKLLKNNTNRGKGFSVRTGVMATSGDIVLFSDADLSTPIEESEKLLVWFDKGYDVIIGSRGLRESDIKVKQPWYRENMGRIFNLIVRSVVMKDFRDTQCGFKLFRGGIARTVFEKCRIERFGFDVEVLFIAKKAGFRLNEVPVKWYNSPTSKVRILRDSSMMFLDLFRIRINWIAGFYR